MSEKASYHGYHLMQGDKRGEAIMERTGKLEQEDRRIDLCSFAWELLLDICLVRSWPTSSFFMILTIV